MYEIVNKQVKFLTTQYISTCKSAYTKGYALNWVLTDNKIFNSAFFGSYPSCKIANK